MVSVCLQLYSEGLPVGVAGLLSERDLDASYSFSEFLFHHVLHAVGQMCRDQRDEKL